MRLLAVQNSRSTDEDDVCCSPKQQQDERVGSCRAVTRRSKQKTRQMQRLQNHSEGLGRDRLDLDLQKKTFEHLWHEVTDFNMVSTENSSTGLYNREEGRSHSNQLTQRPFNVNTEPGSFTFGSQYRCEPITPRFRGVDG